MQSVTDGESLEIVRVEQSPQFGLRIRVRRGGIFDAVWIYFGRNEDSLKLETVLGPFKKGDALELMERPTLQQVADAVRAFRAGTY